VCVVEGGTRLKFYIKLDLILILFYFTNLLEYNNLVLYNIMFITNPNRKKKRNLQLTVCYLRNIAQMQ
jgi:hypothetical protein